MFKIEKVTDDKGHVLIQDPPIARFLFQNTIMGWFWLAVRLYVGYDFITAGWHKFNTPAWVNVHLNDLRGGKVGVANVCTLDDPSCKGGIIASENYWGCPKGPGGAGCSTTSGPNVLFTPWLHEPVAGDGDDQQ